MSDDHIDLITEKSIKLSDDIEGDALKLAHLPSIVAGTPAAVTASAVPTA